MHIVIILLIIIVIILLFGREGFWGIAGGIFQIILWIIGIGIILLFLLLLFN
tara:strand:- start:691 stop:846 length:156 start_codon:yes stop_codon:yes gene_type:complete